MLPSVLASSQKNCTQEHMCVLSTLFDKCIIMYWKALWWKTFHLFSVWTMYKLLFLWLWPNTWQGEIYGRLGRGFKGTVHGKEHGKEHGGMSTSGQIRWQRDEHWCSTGFLTFPFLTRSEPPAGVDAGHNKVGLLPQRTGNASRNSSKRFQIHPSWQQRLSQVYKSVLSCTSLYTLLWQSYTHISFLLLWQGVGLLQCIPVFSFGRYCQPLVLQSYAT